MYLFFWFSNKFYFDDIVFIVEDLIETIPCLVKKINNFGVLAGFYLNKSKSKILCKNMTPKILRNYHWSLNVKLWKKNKYLGVEVTHTNLDLFSNNYEKLWSSLEKDMGKLRDLKLTMSGRVALITMSVLSKLMFYFQTIPIVKGNFFFECWQRKIMNFIWSGEKPHIKFKIMMDDRSRGGL